MLFGKCLDFFVSKRCIEADPEKIKAIQHMPSPNHVKDVQRLSGCMAYLGRFLAKFWGWGRGRWEGRSLPFYKLLKGNIDFKWTPECHRAFNKLKESLNNATLGEPY